MEGAEINEEDPTLDFNTSEEEEEYDEYDDSSDGEDEELFRLQGLVLEAFQGSRITTQEQLDKFKRKPESSLNQAEKKFYEALKEYQEYILEGKKDLIAKYRKNPQEKYYYYTGSHGYIVPVKCGIDSQDSISKHASRHGEIKFTIFKRSKLCDKIDPTDFSVYGRPIFHRDKKDYNKYLEIKYTQESGIKVTVFIGNKVTEIELEELPNILLEYHQDEFNMGRFELIPDKNNDIFFTPAEIDISDYYLDDDGSLKLPTVVSSFAYPAKGHADKTPVSEEKEYLYLFPAYLPRGGKESENLLESILDDLISKRKAGVMDNGFNVEVFCSNCMHCSDKDLLELKSKFPTWYELALEENETIAHRIAIEERKWESRDENEERESKRRAAMGKYKKKKKRSFKKKKRKTKRSHKKKKRKTKKRTNKRKTKRK